MKIREVILPSKVIIAPMAGVSNGAFRTILRKHMSGLICAEMISDKALNYQNKRTLKMIEVNPDEEPVSLQIFGGEVESIIAAAQFIDRHSNCTFIDINMGCPVKKILKTGGGANLLKDPQKVKKIVEGVVAAVSKPVMVKIRTGFDKDSINYLEIGKIVQEAGASAITLHARTRSQFYAGKADWSCIKVLKDALHIPVIGNGDVASLDDAIALFEQTGCDAIMIGRGVLGNPWLAQQIEHYFTYKERLEEPTYEMRIKQAMEHLDLLVEQFGEKIGVVQMRSHGAWYLKGLLENARIRRELNKVTSYKGMKQIFENYLIFLRNSIL